MKSFKIVAACCVALAALSAALMVFRTRLTLPTNAGDFTATTKAPSAIKSAPVPQRSSAPALTNAVTPLKLALARQDVLWQHAVSEPEFAAFKAWFERYHDAAPEAKLALEAEGVKLAAERRDALKVLIQRDPERALELAAPVAVRRELPPSVDALIEERVNGRGRLSVFGVLAEPGFENLVRPTFHVASIEGRDYDAFVYGRREGEPSRRDIPLNGIAVDGQLAVNESPVRMLEPLELAAWKNGRAEAYCGISQQPATVNNEETAVEFGKEIVFLCSSDHALEYNSRLVAAEGGSGPAGDTQSSDEPAASAYTEGQKRILLIRVDFPDLQGAPFSDSAGLGLLTNLNNYFTEASYGRMTVFPPGAGSDLTPTFRMANNAAYYGTNNYYDPLRAEARTAADAAGYNRANYDFHVVCIGAVPGFNWGGLGYVGGTGAWIRNTSSTGTTAHELGHNLGLNHASFWDTAGQSVIGAGTSVEYGDNYDTMGSGGSSRHFNARYRAYLDWIPATNIVTFSTSGVYRIMAYDLPNSTGTRGLRISRNSGSSQTNNYWLEFRQKANATRWQLNGAELRWAGNGNQRSLLLDTTPGSVNGKDDSAITIGRTYSDRVFGIHITPIARVPTVPASLDIVVNRGSFPANLPPTNFVSAPATNAGVGTALSFSATASDPNNDTLAYAWDFGDGGFSTNNSPNASYSWSSAGEYVVRCTASDMKGGVSTDSLIVRIGAPATFRIAGRVATAAGQPVEGVRVFASTTRVTYSDSDGAYNLTGLPAGSYTLNAVLEGYSFSHPAFINPVAVGPNAANRDFVAGSASAQTTISLVASGAEWRYLDDGSNQGTNWIRTDFDDSLWGLGSAQMGYGDGDEITVVSYGPDPNNKFLTTYFRHAFVVDDPGEFASMTLGFLRDDGGVVYVNGQEVVRSNMPLPPAVITYTNRASGTIDAADESTFFETDLNPALLRAGTNIIAVEVHQANLTSSDMSFDLQLSANSVTNLPRGAFITGPAHNSSYLAPASISITANASAGPGGSISLLEFYEGDNKIGEASARPYSLLWSNVAFGTYSLSVRATDGNGLTLASAPVTVTVGQMLFPRGATWKYLANGANMGSAWKLPAFNDATWLQARARLGFGNDGEVTVINGGPSTARYPTIYFRRWFDASNAAVITNLIFRLQRDDGAVVYLNGVEAFRSNIPLGPIAYTNLASAGVSGPDETTFFETSLPATDLVGGTNLVAVEVHQSSVTSSDLGFDLELVGTGTPLVQAPMLGLETVNGDLRLSWPTSATGLRLYWSPEVGGGANWMMVTDSLTVTNGRNVLMITPGSESRFFQLRTTSP